METKQFFTMVITLAVGVILVAGVLTPVISDTVSTDNAEVVNDFSESLATHHYVSSDYYNSYQYFFKDGNIGAPPDMTWGAEDFHNISALSTADVTGFYATADGYPSISVWWEVPEDTDVFPIEITPLFWSDVEGAPSTALMMTDLTDFELRTHGWNVTVTFTYDDTPYILELDADIVEYMSPNMNGWTYGWDGNTVLKDGSYVLLQVIYWFSGMAEWPSYYLVFEFDESAIEGSNYSLPPVHIVYDGTDYGEFSIVITSLRSLGDGEYTLGSEKYEYQDYPDFQSDEITSSDGEHVMTLSDESWLRSYSTMNISPYVSYTPTEPISPTLVSLITIIPLLMTVGLVVAAIMFVKKE